MKRPITLAMLAMAGAFASFAAHVDANRAMDIALAYAKVQNNAPYNLSAKSIEAMGESMYLVHFAPKGFALVSNDDTAEPIIGYSFESNMDMAQVPENMAYMLDEAAQAVQFHKTHSATNAMWQKIERGTFMQSRGGGEPVDPLISVKFDQGDPYNKYCPGDGKNKALVGCVAVAMSQAMSVQQYPLRPQGRMSYAATGYGTLTIDYDQEPDYDWAAILSGANKNDEAARLLYHAGVSVRMSYGTDGSGIPSNQVYRISNALKDIFGYGEEVTYTWRDGYNGDWEQLLLNELWAGRAIVYNAIDAKGGYGHSFNIDGYDGSKYHLNWGWGGYGNGYFKIDNLADDRMGMNYDSNHVAVTGIGGVNSALKSIWLSDNTIEEGTAANTPICSIKVNGEKPNLSEMSIQLTGAYDQYSAGYKEVPLKYENGLLLTTESISTSEESIYVRVVVTMKDGSNAKLIQGFTFDIEKPQEIESKTSLSYDRVAKLFTVHTKFGAQYVVKDASGNTVASGTTDSDPDFTFSRTLLSAGTNTLEVTLNGKTKTVKIKL